MLKSFDQIKQDLFKAAENNRPDVVEEIFSNGLHPDAMDKFGNSVIVIAVSLPLTSASLSKTFLSPIFFAE